MKSKTLHSTILASLVIGACVSYGAAPEISRKVAAESIVLLKNDGVLPLEKSARVRYVESAGESFIVCGKGAAWVHTAYQVDLRSGLINAGFTLDDSASVAVMPVVRDSTENRECESFDTFYLSAAEKAKIAELKSSGAEKLIVVLNTGTIISLSELKEDPFIAAILYVSFPGMEGGNAAADVLSGAVNPSGLLDVTFAACLGDYPADATWQKARQFAEYEEDIFVGYRYFSTIPGAAEKVVYPFGYGLSYTDFTLGAAKVENRGGTFRVEVGVKNDGKLPGRKSVLLYSGVEGGKLEHPKRELRAFAKTRLLAPGECETLEISFPRQSIACFDDEGASGKIGSWVIDSGRYSLYLGDAVDSAAKIYEFEERGEILSTPGFKLDPARLSRRLRADGSYTLTPVLHGDEDGRQGDVKWPEKDPEKKIMFDEVIAGKATLDEFIDQLPLTAIVKLLQGQDNILAVGNTRSIGVLKEYGVRGMQTADGPLGIRLGPWREPGEKPSPEQCATAFPATALAACSFDTALLAEYGRTLGKEAAEAGIDILLAPGVNLARHPLCGRNFEYFGEDPYLAGTMAAAYIGGVQSAGVASTIKHLTANNRENTRKEMSCVVSERTMREIYLKPFEIAIKTAKPKCIMTSYNRLNGEFTGASYGLLEGIVRGEWGFDGVVMTDWHARSHLWQNIAAGNDVKMPDCAPLGYAQGAFSRFLPSDFPTEAAILINNAAFMESAERGLIDPRRIRESVRRILRLMLPYEN